MQSSDQQDVTVLLARIRSGDDSAKGELLDLTYTELRALAGHMFKHQPSDHTLQPTALVNELCVRLLRTDADNWEDRKHFFRAAAKAMRNLLTDHARARHADRRGGNIPTVSFDPSMKVREKVGGGGGGEGGGGIDLALLEEALSRLTLLQERLGQVFELRFLVGLSVERTAEMLAVSARTVELDTKFIRAWLHKELHG